MELKVKEIGHVEPKSKQEVEAELLKKHDEQFAETEQEEVVVEDTTETESTETETAPAVEEKEIKETPSVELTEENVLSFIKERYDKEINSVDDLFQEQKVSESIPEDVANFLKYKKETGRSIEDYVKLQQNFDDMPDDTLLRNYYLITEEGLDSEDVDYLMEEFDIDEEIDEKSEIRKKKVAKKKAIAKAKGYFRKQQEAYKQPLESSGAANLEESDEYKKLKQWYKDALTQNDAASSMRDRFVKRTEDYFDSEFKGFKFNIGDKEVVFSPQSAEELRSKQNDFRNFVNRYTDSNGEVSNLSDYHRALALAMNPDKFAEFFYEQGKAEATEDVMRKTKNIKMNTRQAPEVVSKGGMKIKSLSNSSGRGLKIRSIKKK